MNTVLGFIVSGVIGSLVILPCSVVLVYVAYVAIDLTVRLRDAYVAHVDRALDREVVFRLERSRVPLATIKSVPCMCSPHCWPHRDGQKR